MKIKITSILIFFFILLLIFSGCQNPTVNTNTNSSTNDGSSTDPTGGDPSGGGSGGGSTPPIVINENFGPTESWTFMIYMNADNNGEHAQIEDFNEIVSGLNGLDKSNIKVVVLIDRAIDGNSENYLGETEDWTGARIYEINQDNTYTKKTDGWFNDGDEINMGDGSTLRRFIEYCKTYYIASHYALILIERGGDSTYNGFNKSSLRAFMFDSIDPSNLPDWLYLDEVQQAVSQYFNSNNKLDFIGFDASYMATVEVAYEFRDLAKVMAGSMAHEYEYGWDYQKLFSYMKEGTTDDPIELGKLVVKQFQEYYSSNNIQTDTVSAIDLTMIADLKAKIDELAVAIYNENKQSAIESLRDSSIHFYIDEQESVKYPYFDIYDFCKKIINDTTYGFSTDLKNAALDVIDKLS